MDLSAGTSAYQLLLDNRLRITFEPETRKLIQTIAQALEPLPAVSPADAQLAKHKYDFELEKRVCHEVELFRRREAEWQKELDERRRRLLRRKQRRNSTSLGSEGTPNTAQSGATNRPLEDDRAERYVPSVERAPDSPKPSFDFAEFEQSLAPSDPFEAPTSLNEDLHQLNRGFGGTNRLSVADFPGHSMSSRVPMPTPALPASFQPVDSTSTPNSYASHAFAQSTSLSTGGFAPDSPGPSHGAVPNQTEVTQGPRLPARTPSTTYARPLPGSGHPQQPARPLRPAPAPPTSLSQPPSSTPPSRGVSKPGSPSPQGSGQSSEKLPTAAHRQTPTAPTTPFTVPTSPTPKQQLLAMGFSEQGANIGVAVYGSSMRELIEFATFHDERISKGHMTPQDIDVAWNLFGIRPVGTDNSKKRQFLEYINLFVQLREMGFENHAIHDGLMTHDRDRSRTLEYLLGAGGRDSRRR